MNAVGHRGAVPRLHVDGGAGPPNRDAGRRGGGKSRGRESLGTQRSHQRPCEELHLCRKMPPVATVICPRRLRFSGPFLRGLLVALGVGSCLSQTSDARTFHAKMKLEKDRKRVPKTDKQGWS